MITFTYLIRSGSGYNFHLVVETDGTRMKYTPRNDFHLAINDFPHIVLEVNSQSNEADKFRMLLQAACLSRIGNWLRNPDCDDKDRPIAIMAIYIDEGFRAHQYILCQPDVGMVNAILFKVEFVTRVFDLTVPRTAFEFIFQLYNFFSDAEADNDRLLDPKSRLRNAEGSVARKGYPTLTSARTKRRREEKKKKKAVKKSKPNPPQEEEASFDNLSVQREVTRAGYTCTEPISEELTLLAPVSCNSRR